MQNESNMQNDSIEENLKQVKLITGSLFIQEKDTTEFIETTLKKNIINALSNALTRIKEAECTNRELNFLKNRILKKEPVELSNIHDSFIKNMATVYQLMHKKIGFRQKQFWPNLIDLVEKDNQPHPLLIAQFLYVGNFDAYTSQIGKNEIIRKKYQTFENDYRLLSATKQKLKQILSPYYKKNRESFCISQQLSEMVTKLKEVIQKSGQQIHKKLNTGGSMTKPTLQGILSLVKIAGANKKGKNVGNENEIWSEFENYKLQIEQMKQQEVMNVFSKSPEQEQQKIYPQSIIRQSVRSVLSQVAQILEVPFDDSFFSSLEKLNSLKKEMNELQQTLEVPSGQNVLSFIKSLKSLKQQLMSKEVQIQNVNRLISQLGNDQRDKNNMENMIKEFQEKFRQQKDLKDKIETDDEKQNQMKRLKDHILQLNAELSSLKRQQHPRQEGLNQNRVKQQSENTQKQQSDDRNKQLKNNSEQQENDFEGSEKNSINKAIKQVNHGKLGQQLKNPTNDLIYSCREQLRDLSKLRQKTSMHCEEEKFIIDKIQDYTDKTVKCLVCLAESQKHKLPLKSHLLRQPQNLIVLRIKETRHIVAGYSSLSYCGTVGMSEVRGLLMETKHKKIFPLRKGYSPITFDENCIIFGNGEFILGSERNQIEVCQTSEAYDLRQQKLEDIFCSNNLQKIQLEQYTVYRVYFQEEEEIKVFEKRKRQRQKSRQTQLKRDLSPPPKIPRLNSKQTDKLRSKQIQQFKQTVAKKSKELESKSKIIEKLKEQINTEREKVSKLEDQLFAVRTRIKQSSSKNQKVDRLSQVLIQKEKQIEKLRRQMKTFQRKEQQREQQKEKVMKLQNEIKILESYKRNHSQRRLPVEKQKQEQKMDKIKIKNLQDEQRITQEELSVKNTQLSQKINFIAQKKIQFDKLKLNLESFKRKNITIQKILKEKNKTIYQLEAEIRQKISQVNSHNKMQEKFSEEKKQLKQNKSSSKFDVRVQNYLFDGDVFDKTIIEEKVYLKKEIQKVMNKRVVKTRLVYDFPRMNNFSFHEFVDNKWNYLVLVRLENDKVIAAFSQEPLVKGGPVNRGKGFLASVTNRKVFELDRSNIQSKLTIYDNYFILFGNSELKIKIGQAKVQSLFGIAHKYLKTGQHKNPNILFGSEDRSSKIKCYEIYEVQFENL